MTIRCPLEFEHAEEARAAKVADLAKQYGVSSSCIAAVLSGRNWREDEIGQ